MAFLKEKIQIGIEEAELNAQNTFYGFSRVARIYLAVAAILIIPGYFVSKIVAEKIWLSRDSAQELSAKPSFTDPQAPQRSEVSIINIGPGVYGAAVEIENKNLDLSFKDAFYEFKFYNAAKQEIYKSTGSTFLLPDQKKFIVLPRFTSQETPEFAEFNFTGEIFWQKRLEIPEVKVTGTNPKYFEQLVPPAFVAEGDFVNDSAYTLKEVTLVFVIKDFANKITGISRRDERDVRTGERRAYKQLWPNLSGVSVRSVEVFLYVNSLDPDNLF